MADEGKLILAIGLCALDIVTYVNKYPEEDKDYRATDLYWQRGGNASNTCTVLSLLGRKSEYFGTLGDSHEISFIDDNLTKYGIITENCVRHTQSNCPNSIIIINKENASRTIMHYNKNLPEPTLDDLKRKIDLKNYKWIHLEGRRRNKDEIKKMLRYMNDSRSQNHSSLGSLKVSVELEKPDLVDLEDLAQLADYVFISKDYAAAKGYKSKEEAVEGFINKCSIGVSLICAWGELGASAKAWHGPVVSSPAYPPNELVDTLGAGDTFNAATITALSEGANLETAINFGCQVAGAKCGIRGYDGLANFQFTF